MKSVLKWISSIGDDEPEPQPKAFTIERVEEYIRFFPIGTRIRYSPEFQISTKIESLILGYRINGYIVFEAHALRFNVKEGALALLLRTERGMDEITVVSDFCFILPHQYRSEVDFGADFGDQELMREKKVNDFRRGGMLRLMNKGLDGKVPSVDATVLMTLGVAQGVYANTRVVLLVPDEDSFLLMDQRVFHRVYTHIPATVAVDVSGPRYQCTLLDFSERYLRLSMDDSPKFAAGLRESAKIFVLIEGDQPSQTILLGGQVYRKRGANCVIALTHILKDNRLQRIDPLDELELKTKLLHHPKTLELKGSP